MNPNQGSSLLFSVQTMQTNICGALKSIHPDKNGIYHGVPLAVIGKPSRNNILYEPASFVDSIVNPKSRFFKSLIGGGLEGEWGHPMNIGLSDKDAIARTLQIDRSNVSHTFLKIYSKRSKDGQYFVVYGDLKASGPNGKHLTDSFADESCNTAFSLRSLTTNPEQTNAGYFKKKILALITFDSVSTPGFEEATKCNMDVGTETLSYSMNEEEGRCVSAEDIIATPNCAEVIGCESITNQSLLDMLQVDKVTIKTHNTVVVGRFDKNVGGIYVSDTALASSAFHNMF